LGKRPLAGVFFGGNDVRGAETFEEAQIAVLGAMQGLAAGISKLSAAGFEEFLVFGLPNLARLPAVVQSPTPADDAGALEASKGFNSALKGTLEALSTLGTFYFFDTFAFLEGEIAKAEAAGVNVTQSCLGTPGCSPANVKDFQILDPELTTGFVFYDDLHPTDRVHTALADAVTVYLEAIPLPAGGFLLIGALGALGVASGRRVAVRTH
ncbi:MAG: SGNH/GDSL hydrolase family protein, partial [Pseudomonadota bacterium]